MRTQRRAMGAIVAGLFITLCAVWPVAAATSGAAAGVVRSYPADKPVRQGMIVALSASNANDVEPLTNSRIDTMFGVAIAPTDAPLSLSSDSSSQVYVATSGQYNVLVSTENGAIHAGDYISISGLDGIGMKANDSQSTVLGRAAADLTTDRVIERAVTVKTAYGNNTVALGSIPVNIAIATNPAGGQDAGGLPGFLWIASTGIANKPVPAARVYAALGALVLTGFISASILYSGIRGGIVSIGRNPLAKKSILSGTMQAVSIGTGVFIIGLIAVYLLLRL